MSTLTDLTAVVKRFADALPDLNLDGDEQEEYSTMLLRLQDQAETCDPDQRIVDECLRYLARVAG
jgi:hypothetical protein